LGRPGAFKSEKRKKELNRQQKQEKKRQRRLGVKDPMTGEIPAENDSIECLPLENTGEADDKRETVE
jgi:hypothetical protein